MDNIDLSRFVFLMPSLKVKCADSAKFGQMSAFLKLQIICNNLKLGEMPQRMSQRNSEAISKLMRSTTSVS